MIYGPYIVQAHAADGSETGIPADGVHYTADVATYAKNAGLLSPYKVEPTHPLQHVLAGDDPAEAPWCYGEASPAWQTVCLRFPDQDTADGVIAQLD